jgi:uncharacterized protein YdiU (UPF0061 family)
LNGFPHLFYEHWLNGMRGKLGLFTSGPDDEALVNELLAWMRERSADFTNTFRSLTRWLVAKESAGFEPGLEPWLAAVGRASRTAITVRRRGRNLDAWAQPCVHPAQSPGRGGVTRRRPAQGDLSVMEKLLEVLANPFDYERDLPKYTEPGTDHGTYRTYCGT